MKKSLVILMIILAIMSLTLVSCTNQQPSDNQSDNNESQDNVDNDINANNTPNTENNEDDTDENISSEDIFDNEMSTLISSIYDNASTKAQTVTTFQQLAILTSITASLDGDDDVGPISVTPAVLNDELITLVTLGGTEIKDGQATSMRESQLASMGRPNDYLRAVTNLFYDKIIPNDRPILITGISLGGMIAQQLLGEKFITDNFDIRAIITFGSPLNPPMDRKGVKVVRFADSNDMIPKMGETTLPSFGVKRSTINKLNAEEKIIRSSEYNDNPLLTHALSYINGKCWDEFDFMGDAPNTNTLILTKDMTFYDAPSISK